MTTTTYSSPLMARTQHLLRNRPKALTFDMIAADCGLKRQWVIRFQQGYLKQAACNRVECLYKYLTGKEVGL